MAFEIDHVVWRVNDLEPAGEHLHDRFGLVSVPGGRHPGWGTANRILPLGPSYLELIAVVDEGEAAGDPTGRRWLERRTEPEGPLLLCLRTGDIDAAAARLGLEVGRKSRIRPDGVEIAWRSAGLDIAMERPWLPFFIDWEVPLGLHPGRTPIPGGGPASGGISWVQVGADPAELAEWLGGESVPVRLAGSPRVNALGVALGGGEVVLGEPER
ncbi:MAG: VOC family protein [Actinomycetota bacterium]